MTNTGVKKRSGKQGAQLSWAARLTTSKLPCILHSFVNETNMMTTAKKPEGHLEIYVFFSNYGKHIHGHNTQCEILIL